MTSIGLVTDIAFWEVGNGQNARIRELYYFLEKKSLVSLYYLGTNTCSISSPPFKGKSQLAVDLKKANHDLIIVEKLRLDWVADLGIKSPMYLDAHDLLSDRKEAFQRFDREWEGPSFEEELSLYSKFDKIIFLQKEELEKVAAKIGKDKVLLCPHPVVPFQEISLRKEVKSIGFLGGPSQANVDGVQWFHDAVLPLIGDLASKCTLYGAINYSPFHLYCPRLSRRDMLDSSASFYEEVDIAINPVLYGSGLKIKTVEAMAYGIPLVTTSAGVQGLSEEKNRSFLLADTPEEFAESIRKLTTSFDLRSKLSLSSKHFAKKHFTPEICFNPLISS